MLSTPLFSTTKTIWRAYYVQAFSLNKTTFLKYLMLFVPSLTFQQDQLGSIWDYKIRSFLSFSKRPGHPPTPVWKQWVTHNEEVKQNLFTLLEYMNTSLSVHTQILSSSLQSILPGLSSDITHVSLAPCWLEPLSFSSWMSCAEVVFIVSFSAVSWLSCIVKVLELSALPVLLSLGMCVPILSVCKHWIWNA